MGTPKRMKLRKSSKRPPSFSKNHVADFATKLRQKCVCSLWRTVVYYMIYISHEMHVVQQFNVVIGCKHTQNKTFCIIFMQKKPYLKSKICNINFWIENVPPPPPFGTFPKIHPFWCAHPSRKAPFPHGIFFTKQIMFNVSWEKGNILSCVEVPVGQLSHF